MSFADNILRTLTSSSNDKFDGALQILDIITQLVADRLGASICASFYRKADADPCDYRLLSIEDTAGVQSEELGELERFVQDNVDRAGFLDRYVDASDPDIICHEHSGVLLNRKVRALYAYRFTPGVNDSALILACLSDVEQTGVHSADKVCGLASQQMRVVFDFVELEIKERALKSFMRVLLRLSALTFRDVTLAETVESIRPLGAELSRVRYVTLIERDKHNHLYKERLEELERISDKIDDLDPTALDDAGILIDPGAELLHGRVSDGAYVSALEHGSNPRWLLVFEPNAFAGFDSQSIELIHLFCNYAAIAISNHDLALRERRINDDLRHAQDRLVEAESLAALGDMASGLAHDFNNLLGAVIGKLQVLQLKSEPGELRDTLGEIEALSREGAMRIKRLQEFAISVRPASLEPIDIVELYQTYQGATHSWEATGKEKSVLVSFEKPSITKAIIRGKTEDICILLDSIISNAVDVTAPGGCVSVSLVVDSGRILFRIQDRGPGIPDSIKNKIFNPFFTTKKDQGAGLGLSMAHGIAVRHGGSISAQSSKGSIGATFTTSFPLVESPIEEATVTEQTTPESRPSLQVLVVDDDPQIREVLGDMLRLMDQETDVFPDGPSALAEFTSGKYDLVITDLGMPGMSGLELTTKLKEHEPSLPVAMVTGWGAQLDDQEMISRGVFRVISKPFYLKDIRGLLNDVVNVSH